MCLSHRLCAGTPNCAFIAIGGHIASGINFGLDFDVPLIGWQIREKSCISATISGNIDDGSFDAMAIIQPLGIDFAAAKQNDFWPRLGSGFNPVTRLLRWRRSLL
jgi:hypothetical protein